MDSWSYQLVYVSLITYKTSDPRLRMGSFIVYAASAIYIVGIPGVRLDHEISEQKALLGISLYVLACKSDVRIGNRDAADMSHRRDGSYDLGTIE